MSFHKEADKNTITTLKASSI